MRLILSTLITIIFWIGVTAQTPVPPGPISGTWTIDGSPYLIEGNNTIEDGTTLTIEPGVEVRWLNENCPMYVYGRILAIGTESDSITFTRDVPNASFGSIRFYSTPNTNDSSIFKYCLFEHGKVFGDIPDNCGGAIALFEFEKVIIDHCSFFDNKAVDVSIYTIPLGGAIALRNASPTIRNCLFKNNSCYAGGAIGLFLNSDPEIKNNVFTNNTAVGSGYAQGYGGAIVCYVICSPSISYNTFSNNTANQGGGAIGMVSRCDPTIDHNLIIHNTSNWLGGGIEVQDTCSPNILNNTIIYNNADYGGGIDFWRKSEAIVMNSILWGNTGDIGGAQIYLQHEACIPDFEYCDIEGGQEAFGGVPHSGKYIDCIDEDPLFSGPPEYCITWENWPDPDTTKSPCIDTGCPTMKDPDSTRCDIGYCYFPQPVGFSDNWQQNESIPLWIYPNPSTGIFDIRYSISDIRNIQIGLYDLSGKLVLAVSNEVRHPGEHSNTVYVSDLSDGLYFLRLTSGKDQVVKKLIIRH